MVLSHRVWGRGVICYTAITNSYTYLFTRSLHAALGINVLITLSPKHGSRETQKQQEGSYVICETLGIWVRFVTPIIPELSQAEPGSYGLVQVNLFVPQCPYYNGDTGTFKCTPQHVSEEDRVTVWGRPGHSGKNTGPGARCQALVCVTPGRCGELGQLHPSPSVTSV